MWESLKSETSVSNAAEGNGVVLHMGMYLDCVLGVWGGIAVWATSAANVMQGREL